MKKWKLRKCLICKKNIPGSAGSSRIFCSYVCNRLSYRAYWENGQLKLTKKPCHVAINIKN